MVISSINFDWEMSLLGLVIIIPILWILYCGIRAVWEDEGLTRKKRIWWTVAILWTGVPGALIYLFLVRSDNDDQS